MPDNPNKLSLFWQELKRRGVIKVIAMYAATAFIIMEAADIMLPRLGLPDWTVTLIIILLIVGFPIAIIFSWIFDTTSEGIKKTETIEKVSEQEPLPSIVKKRLKASDISIAVLLVAVCVLLYPKVFKTDKLKDLRDLTGRISVAVMPFKNISNDSSLDIWQAGVQNDLITRLSNSEDLIVSGYESIHDILQTNDIKESAQISVKTAGELSLKLDANTVILGSILSSGKMLRLNVQLVNSNTGRILKTYQVEGNAENEIFNTIDSLSYLIKNYLEIKALEQEADFDYLEAFTESADAYRYYIEGMKFLVDQKYDASVQPFKKALEIDSSFTMAMFYLAFAHTFIESSTREQMEYWLLKAYDRRYKLHLKHQYLLEQWYAVLISKNLDDIIKYLDLQEYAETNSRLLWFDMGITYHTIHQYDKAAKVFEKIQDLSQKYGENWQYGAFYSAYAYALYHLGECDKIEEIFDLCMKVAPEQSQEIRLYQAICALSKNDSIRAEGYLEQYISNTEGKNDSAARTNLAIGYVFEEANYIAKAEEYYRLVYDGEPQNTKAALDLAYLLIVNEINVKEGMELIDKALKLNPERPSLLMLRGIGLFKQGKLDEALNFLNNAWGKRGAFSYDHYDYIQQVEQALASQNI